MPAARDLLAVGRSALRPRTRYRNALAARVQVNVYTVIRFSLRYESYMRIAFAGESQRAEWFAMRARLFKACIVASMAEQTVAPRRVFVLMDVADIELWRDHLDLPAPFVPVFTAADDAFDEVARRIRADRTRNVVLSRLDSDDAISRRYYEKVVAAARESWRLGKDHQYFVTCNGYFTSLGRIQKIYYNCSPFICLFLRRYTDENIFDGDHTQILERSPQMIETTSWIQVIHGTNIDNRLYKESKFLLEDERKMIVGPLVSADKAWPPGFPPGLLANARAALLPVPSRATTTTSSASAGADTSEEDGHRAATAVSSPPGDQ